MKTVSIKNTYWDIAADIYFPDDFNSEKSILPLSVPIQLEAAKNRHRVVCMVPPWQKLALSSLLLMPVFREAAVENRVIWKIQQCE